MLEHAEECSALEHVEDCSALEHVEDCSALEHVEECSALEHVEDCILQDTPALNETDKQTIFIYRRLLVYHLSVTGLKTPSYWLTYYLSVCWPRKG